jgi:hypothetical protein
MAGSLVSDDLYAAIAPLLPPEPPRPKGGQPRVPALFSPSYAASLQEAAPALSCKPGFREQPG